MNQVISIGKQDFASLREGNYFFVDKTHFISEWWESGDDITLIARPRRFGKTLNMSMLKAFFEIGIDTTLFDDLYISKNQALCERYMGKYPVIFLTLKGVDGLTFEAAKYRLAELIGAEAE